MPNAAAYFLIAHGSRDLRSRQGLEACATWVRQGLAANQDSTSGQPLVGSGVLEFGDQPLAMQMTNFAKAAVRKGVHQVFLLPLFLVSGNHVNQDLPEAVHEAKAHISPDLALILCPFLGSHPNIGLLVQERIEAAAPCDRWILLAHGTRRPNGNAAIDTLATQLGATAAYWATAPSLEDQCQALRPEPSAQRIGIVPYFLFPGRTIDAIRQRVLQLQSLSPSLELLLTDPLNPSVLLAKLLLECCATFPPLLDIPQRR